MYAAYIVAGDAWPDWLGSQVFVTFDQMGGVPAMAAALVVLAAVPAAFQYGLWDSSAQDRCRRLELLLLTDLDRQLVALVAERKAVSEEVARVKRATGHPTRDYEREREVILGVRTMAAARGLSPELAEQLLRLLLRSSMSRGSCSLCCLPRCPQHMRHSTRQEQG